MQKPLLAAKCPPGMSIDDFLDEIFKHGYEYGGTPKIDGIRCRTGQTDPFPVMGFTRTNKAIPNSYIRYRLQECPPGLDGELTYGQTFQSSISGIMSQMGEPDFTYWVFGARIDCPEFTYRDVHKELLRLAPTLPSFCRPLYPVTITNLTDFQAYEAYVLSQGAEGVMLRRLDKGYKYGRSTLKEGHLIAIKRFLDSEARIIGFIELQHNENEIQFDAFYNIKRSSAQAGKVPGDTLGALIVEDLETKTQFEIGTGFDANLRQTIWNSRDLYLNSIVKYKYQPHGMKDKPRSPVFLGFRSPLDFSTNE